MKLSFVLKESFKGLGRNFTMAFALIVTTAISLSLVTAGVLVSMMASDTKDIYLERVEVMVQLDEEISTTDEDCTSQACSEVKQALESEEGVESVIFRSQAQSYERFVEVFGETDPVLVEETSPDALPAALHVRLTDPTDTSPLDPIRDLPQVGSVIDQVEDVRGATDNLDTIRNATFLLAVVQAVAAIFLIANMVQIAAFNRRDEIAIMRIVGASRWYTQAPFVIEAMLATLLGAIVAGVGLFAAKFSIVDPSLAGLYESQLIAPIRTRDIWASFPAVAVVGMLFSGITAYITLRSYVRK